MTALKILLVVLLILFLIGLIRVGGEGEYGAEGATVKVKVGSVKIRVFPLKKKDPKAQEEKKRRKEEKKKAKEEKKKAKEEKKRAKEAQNKAREEKRKAGAGAAPNPQGGAAGEVPQEQSQPSEEEKPQKKGGTLTLVQAGLPLVGEAAGELKRKIRIDELSLDLVLGGQVDAARAAMAFGWANAVIGGILPLFENNFNVKERQIRTGMDFNAPGTTVWIRAAFSARIGQLLSFALRFGWKFLRRYLAQKKAGTTKKGAN